MKKALIIAGAAIVLVGCKQPVCEPVAAQLPNTKHLIQIYESDLISRQLDSTLYRLKCDFNYMEAREAEQKANIDLLSTSNPYYEKLFYKHQKNRVYWAKEGIRVDAWLKKTKH